MRMTLRTRLTVLQLSTIVVVSAIIVALLASFFKRSIPLMEDSLRIMTGSCLQAMLTEADVALATGDAKLARHALDRCTTEAHTDLGFAALVTADGQVLARRGSVPADLDRRARPAALRITALGDRFRGQAPVVLEGKFLGTGWAEFTLQRLASWKQQHLLFSSGAMLLIIVSGIVSVFFAARMFRPLPQLLDHVHLVARGDLDHQLAAPGSDELARLADDLNEMTSKLRESRRLAIDASRDAGRAEVATSVLHNVGNVMNSVAVSVEVLIELLRASRLARIGDVAGLVQAPGPDFFAPHGKWAKLVQYLPGLAARLEAERGEMLAELGRLREHTEHLKTIVAAQQQFAGAAGVTDIVTLEELVEAAVQISSSAVINDSTVVERRFEPVPRIRVDRHKLLVVLVNLLSNAKQAVQRAPGADRAIAVAIALRDAETIAVTVSDHGVGIAPENLARVFQYGFSTRQDGHGFGLHSSANLARELGGSLSCASPGPGQGATFVLTLPVGTSAPQAPVGAAAGKADGVS